MVLHRPEIDLVSCTSGAAGPSDLVLHCCWLTEAFTAHIHSLVGTPLVLAGSSRSCSLIRAESTWCKGMSWTWLRGSLQISLAWMPASDRFVGMGVLGLSVSKY